MNKEQFWSKSRGLSVSKHHMNTLQGRGEPSCVLNFLMPNLVTIRFKNSDPSTKKKECVSIRLHSHWM